MVITNDQSLEQNGGGQLMKNKCSKLISSTLIFINTEKPIIPRDEIKKLEIKIKYRIDVGESIGLGFYDGWKESGVYPFIDLEITNKPSWCSAALAKTTLTANFANFTRYSETSVDLYITLDETAPAFGDGFIDIKARTRALGKIQSTNETFTLYFAPAYLPIIKTYLPEDNTMRINPMDTAEFPIEIENVGNARTKVFFEIESIPEDWQATVTDHIILDETKGSKERAMLSIIPSNDFGYHYDEEIIIISITPTRAENQEEKGNTIYATFLVKNRGLSTMGSETIMPIALVIILIFGGILYIIFKNIDTEKQKIKKIKSKEKTAEKDAKSIFSSNRIKIFITNQKEKDKKKKERKPEKKPMQFKIISSKIRKTDQETKKEETSKEKKPIIKIKENRKESLGTKFTNFFKEFREKSEEGKQAKKEEKIIEETSDIEKGKAPKVESPKKTAEQRRKEKVLLRIKRKQEKQKLKNKG